VRCCPATIPPTWGPKATWPTAGEAFWGLGASRCHERGAQEAASACCATQSCHVWCMRPSVSCCCWCWVWLAGTATSISSCVVPRQPHRPWAQGLPGLRQVRICGNGVQRLS
jgi:hypothetical protein